MDVGYCNLYADARQADMAAMMVELEKYPEFLSGAPLPAASVLDFSLGVHQLPPLYDTPPATPPASLFSPQPTLSGDSAGGAVSSPPVYTDLPAAAGLTTVPANTCAGGAACNLTAQTTVAAMREMMFLIAAMQPIHIDPESVKPPKRRNVRISKDPQSVAARHRRERISEKIRILQRLVPGGTKMDTASMLDEAIHYVKFLKTQVQSLEWAAANRSAAGEDLAPAAVSASSYADVAAGGNYAFIGGDEPPESCYSWAVHGC